MTSAAATRFLFSAEKPVKALHIFPTFGTETRGGSDYYQRMLTRALVQQGVEVEVLTTTSRRIVAHAAFGLGWPDDHPSGPALVDGIDVRRFPVTFSPGAATGHLLSRPILQRWRREERRDGGSFPEPGEIVDSHYRRARARPMVYDYLALLGRGPHSLALARAARSAARRADVLLAGFTPFATLWYAVRAAEHARKPLVVLPLFHPEDPYHHFRLFYRCFAGADALLAQTSYSAALFRRLIPGCNPVEVGAGVDPEEFADERVSGERFRRRHGLGDAKIVLFVGRKERHKRWHVAVEAVERIGDDRVRLLMVGEDVDRLPIHGSRILHFESLERADLLDAYDACDVFVLPSEHESFGIVFLEAWMRGKPVIGNAACAPVGSLIDAGRDGLLATDADQLRSQIEILLTDANRARRMGEAGRAKVLRRYTWQHVGSTVRSLYEELAARQRLLGKRT